MVKNTVQIFMLNVTDKPAEEKKGEERGRERERKAHAFLPAELERFYSDIEYIGEGEFARIFKAARNTLPIPYLRWSSVTRKCPNRWKWKKQLQ